MREFSNDSLYTRVENYDISQIGRVVSGLEEEYRYEEAIHLVDKCLEMAELKFKFPQKKKSRIAKNSYLETLLKRKKRLIALQGKPVIQKVPWVILPRGLLDSSLIENRLSAIFGTDNEKIDEAKKRLNAIKRLSPNKVWMGTDSFNDYLAYEFSESSSVMLESLKHGNATFIIKENWKKLSKLSKREIAKHTGVKRIIHDCPQNLWVRKVEAALSL